ncbi:MAG: hypothetical protein ACLU38_14910 [Dysosmobacter sp.]
MPWTQHHPTAEKERKHLQIISDGEPSARAGLVRRMLDTSDPDLQEMKKEDFDSV